MANPKNIVILSLVGTGGVVIVSDIQEGNGIRGTHLLALGIVGVVLTATADTVPKIAIPLALLVFVGVLLSKGAKLFGNLTGGLTATTKVHGQAAANTVKQSSNVSGTVVPAKRRLRSTGPSQTTH